MTKPALPPATTSIEVVEIEIDALDGMEWEQGQRTPQASDANLAALVKKSANQPEPAVPHVPRRTPLKARARVTGSEPPQPVRPPDPPLPTGPRAARPVSSGEPGARVTQLGPPVAPVPVPHIPRLVAPDLDRPISPPPPIVARAGSPPLEHTGTDFDVSTRNNTLQRGATPAVPSGPPRTLNDILRAPARVVSAESVAPTVVLPLPAPVESARHPAPLAIPGPTAPRLSEDPGALGSTSWRRLVLVIGGLGGCALLVAAVITMTSRRSDEHASAAAARGQAPVVDEPEVAGGAVAASSASVVPGSPVGSPATPGAPARPDAPIEPDAPAKRIPLALASEPAPPPGMATSPPGRRPGRKAGGKKIVVDYGTRSEATPGLVAKDAEDPAIGLARSAYVSGNQQLFAGDAAGAIRAYRQALSLYPGYVGGYRGLGLAYDQLGDTQNALEAFTTYVETVPDARDVALIKKRIARLQGR